MKKIPVRKESTELGWCCCFNFIDEIVSHNRGDKEFGDYSLGHEGVDLVIKLLAERGYLELSKEGE